MDKHHDTTPAWPSLLRIAAAALVATTITGLAGLLFGPVSDHRARQLAEGFAAGGAKEGASLDRGSSAASAPSVGRA